MAVCLSENAIHSPRRSASRRSSSCSTLTFKSTSAQATSSSHNYHTPRPTIPHWWETLPSVHMPLMAMLLAISSTLGPISSSLLKTTTKSGHVHMAQWSGRVLPLLVTLVLVSAVVSQDNQVMVGRQQASSSPSASSQYLLGSEKTSFPLSRSRANLPELDGSPSQVHSDLSLSMMSSEQKEKEESFQQPKQQQQQQADMSLREQMSEWSQMKPSRLPNAADSTTDQSDQSVSSAMLSPRKYVRLNGHQSPEQNSHQTAADSLAAINEKRQVKDWSSLINLINNDIEQINDDHDQSAAAVLREPQTVGDMHDSNGHAVLVKLALHPSDGVTNADDKSQTGQQFQVNSPQANYEQQANWQLDTTAGDPTSGDRPLVNKATEQHYTRDSHGQVIPWAKSQSSPPVTWWPLGSWFRKLMIPRLQPNPNQRMGHDLSLEQLEQDRLSGESIGDLDDQAADEDDDDEQMEQMNEQYDRMGLGSGGRWLIAKRRGDDDDSSRLNLVKRKMFVNAQNMRFRWDLAKGDFLNYTDGYHGRPPPPLAPNEVIPQPYQPVLTPVPAFGKLFSPRLHKWVPNPMNQNVHQYYAHPRRQTYPTRPTTTTTPKPVTTKRPRNRGKGKSRNKGKLMKQQQKQAAKLNKLAAQKTINNVVQSKVETSNNNQTVAVKPDTEDNKKVLSSPSPNNPNGQQQVFGFVSRGQRDSSSKKLYDVPQIECPSSENGIDRFSCPSPDIYGRFLCIDDQHICNGYVDCPKGEDEDPMSCMFYKSTKAHLDVLADYLLQWARGRHNAMM